MYILLFAAAIGVGTFIENDFGTSSAQHVIYKSWWFSLLLALFCITIGVNMVRFKMVRQKKWALLMFHLAMIVSTAPEVRHKRSRSAPTAER